MDATLEWVLSQTGDDTGLSVPVTCKQYHQDSHDLSTVDSYQTLSSVDEGENTISSYMTRTDSEENNQLNKTVDTYHTLPDSIQTIESYQTKSDTDDESIQQLDKDDDNEEHVDPPPKRRRYFPPPLDVLKQDCCIDQCNRQLSVNDVETCQLLMKDKKENEQMNFILKEVSNHTLINHSDNNYKHQTYHFVIGGKQVSGHNLYFCYSKILCDGCGSDKMFIF